jgi:acetyltransferase
MTIRNLDVVFAPKSVVLIGASPKAGSVGKIIASNIGAGAFKGPVWLVNPKHTEIDGQRCYRSVSDLPGVADLAVIATPPETIPKLIDELGTRGTRGAVVITAGVTRPLRQAMLAAAMPHLLRIQGPNCLGLMLPPHGLNASFGNRAALTGSMAFVSQSGALITAIVDWASSRGVGFSHVVSLGDMADIDFGDMLDYLAGDAQSSAILLYIEQVTHAAKFMSAARRAARVKPVIVIKAGRHAEGAKAAQSHTGALAGADSAYEAAFRRAGLLRVLELQDLFNAAEMLSRQPRLTGERLVILTNGGGAGVLAVDRLADLGGQLATLPDATIQALNAVMPATWSKGNPVDIIGDADASRYSQALDILSDVPGADAILIMNCPTALASSTLCAQAVVDVRSRRRTANTSNQPVLTCWLGETAAKDARDMFGRERIATFETPAGAIEGFMQLARYTRAQDELMATPPALPSGIMFDADAARTVINSSLARGQSMLSELDAKALLAAYAIPVVTTRVAKTPNDVAAIATRLLDEERTCVVKILSDDITHKSDAGGVRLNLASAHAAQEAATEMLERITREHPKARIDGFTVQAMVHRPGAHELIIGASEDMTFGPIIMFGAGGTSVEVVHDTSQALPPLDMKLARDLMRQTRAHKLLEGYRDRPAADLDAIALTLVKISALLIAHPEIRELDINPLLADEHGVIALDARVRLESQAVKPRQPMAITPYPANLERHINLPKIGDVRVRPIRPEDELLYQELWKRVTPADLRMRFFTAGMNLSHKLIARLTQIDYAREMAFVALDATHGTLLGVARLVADPDNVRGEYAILVASDHHGRGLGWLLMQTLIEYARGRKLALLFGDVLDANTAMLDMCRELGFEIEAAADATAVSRVTLDLTRPCTEFIPEARLD